MTEPKWTPDQTIRMEEAQKAIEKARAENPYNSDPSWGAYGKGFEKAGLMPAGTVDGAQKKANEEMKEKIRAIRAEYGIDKNGYPEEAHYHPGSAFDKESDRGDGKIKDRTIANIDVFVHDNGRAEHKEKCASVDADIRAVQNVLIDKKLYSQSQGGPDGDFGKHSNKGLEQLIVDAQLKAGIKPPNGKLDEKTEASLKSMGIDDKAMASMHKVIDSGLYKPSEDDIKNFSLKSRFSPAAEGQASAPTIPLPKPDLTAVSRKPATAPAAGG